MGLEFVEVFVEVARGVLGFCGYVLLAFSVK
jgi:hypothetical protein